MENEMVMKVITGKSDISAYDEFVKNWKSGRRRYNSGRSRRILKQEKGRPFQCDFQILKDHLLCEKGESSQLSFFTEYVLSIGNKRKIRK